MHGIESLPDGATFRIKPVDAKGNHDELTSAAWPTSEHRPRAVRRTDSGIELLIGPDIVECPALIPGTLGIIEIQAAGVRGEFLWPSIRPTVRPRRRLLSVVKPPPVVEKNAIPVPVSSMEKSGPATPESQLASIRTSATNGTDGLATLFSSRRADSAGKGGFTQNGSSVAVTALDHGVPSAATIEQAIGANVVQLGLQRDKLSAMAHSGVLQLSESLSPPISSSDGTTPKIKGWLQSGRRAATAASVVVLISGALVILGGVPISPPPRGA